MYFNFADAILFFWIKFVTMEVDDDIEANLLRQFNCLNTSDKDVLIKEMQRLLGLNTNISENAARFYLDMADWWVAS